MKEVKKNAFRLIGLRLESKTTNENNQSGKDCGNLWRKFETDKVFDLVPQKLSDEVYAVYYDYEKDERSPFSYFIGCKVGEDAEIPSGLYDLRVPSQNYMKISARGVMPECISEVWRKIWNSDLKRNFGFDFEIYDERSRDWNNAEVDVYISTGE